MNWDQARNYCQKREGDLLQKDPRILTRSGRKLVVKTLNYLDYVLFISKLDKRLGL